MSTSDIEKVRYETKEKGAQGQDGKECARIAFRWLCGAIFFAFFGAVYEQFSHNVYSNWMLYAFGFPLVLGALPFAWIALRGEKTPGIWVRNFWQGGILVLTIGSIMQGVLDIYGTTNRLILGYWVGGAVLLAAGAVLCIRECVQHQGKIE